MRSEAKWRGAARMLAFVAGSAGALALTALAIIRGLDAADVPEPYVDFDGIRVQFELLREFKTSIPVLPTQRIVFLGDSTSMHFPNGDRGVDHRLEAALAELAPDETRHRVFSLAAPGYTQFTQYFLSHRVVATRPDAVVIAFNLASFSNQWREADRPKLAAWLPARSLGEALRLPLHWIGLTTDELVLYSTTIAAGGFEPWRKLLHEQARCVRAWTSLAAWLQARSGAPNGLAYQNLHFFERRRAQFDFGPPDRETPALAHSRLDAVLAGVGPDHPVLRVLRATLDVFRANGIPVYVYIAPMNVEHLERIGVADREALRRGVESVRRVVLASGGSLIDVHDLLPDAAFADGGGHLVADETLDAPVIVARLAAAGRRALAAAGRRALMLFNSFSFLIFFAVFLLAYRLSPRAARIPLLLAASLLFYALWVPAYLLLLLFVIGVNWLLLRAIARGPRPRLALAGSIVFTLSLLAWFKYAVFLVTGVSPLLERLLGSHPVLSEILLPLGISFYSFNILALAIDTARRREGEPPSLVHYALFIAFFPHLIAGPILRGPDFLPQLAEGERMSPARTRRGLWLIASGIAKKMILGDFMLAPFVNDVFASPGLADAPVHWLALYGFAFQIYFDFSGYTDMARGLACLLGYELPVNFVEPYLSRSPAEFWRRWHVTLSSWLRDYLYVPLGGNRRGRARTYLNLLATMLLGGLWHGAGWNFLVWGGLHGLLLVVHRAFAGRAAVQDAPLAWRDAPKLFACFHAVILPWVFFRSANFADAIAFLGGLFTNSWGEWPALQTLAIGVCFALHGLERWARPRLARVRTALGDGPIGGLVEGLAFGTLLALAIAASGTGAEFIYFQF